MNTNAALPSLKRLTPVLIVEHVEPCIRCWIDRLGFAVKQRGAEDRWRPVFASVEKDGIEIMYRRAPA